MKNRVNIENLRKENIFKVPQGYFEKFPERIQGQLRTEEKENLNINWGVEEFGVLNFIEKRNLFLVPENYFETLPDAITSKLPEKKALESALDFSTLQKMAVEEIENDIFKIPANYFDILSEKINQKIISQKNQKVEELDFSALDEAESGILSSLQKKNIFKTPDHYFENSGNKLEEMLNASQPVEINLEEAKAGKQKTIKLIPNWVKYSTSVAAAVVLLVLGLNYYNSEKTAEQPCQSMLCDVSDDELIQYLHDNGVNQELMNESVDDNSGKNLLKNTDIKEEDILNEVDVTTIESMN